MGVEVRCPKCHRFQSGQNTECVCKANLLSMRKRGELTFRVYGYRGKKKVRLPEEYTNLRDALDADAQRQLDKKAGQDSVQYVEHMKRPLGDLIDWYLKHEGIGTVLEPSRHKSRHKLH